MLVIYKLHVSCLLDLIQFYQIIIGGDSAGGNLSLGMMSIIKHSPPFVSPLELDSPVAGVLLICPWVSFESSSGSYSDNASKDVHAAAQMHEWADDFVSLEERNNYSEPMIADTDHWRNLNCKDILILRGDYEIFRDDIEELGQNLEKAGVNVKSVNCARQVHIDCILDSQTGLESGPMSSAVWEWLERVFK